MYPCLCAHILSHLAQADGIHLTDRPSGAGCLHVHVHICTPLIISRPRLRLTKPRAEGGDNQGSSAYVHVCMCVGGVSVTVCVV
jgi:hypothetical protein